MTAPKTSAPAKRASSPNDFPLGRDNTSRPTTLVSTPNGQPSVGTTSSPQANSQAEAIVPSPAGATTMAAANVRAAPKPHSPLPYQTSQAAHPSHGPHRLLGGLASDIPGGHGDDDALAIVAAGDQPQPTATVGVTPIPAPLSAVTPPRTAMDQATPIVESPSGDQLPQEAIGVPTPNDHAPLAGQSPLPASDAATPKGGLPGVAKQGPQVSAILRPTPNQAAPELADPLLALAADVLDDLESVWIANTNRLRQLTRDEEDSDGEERGFGLTLDHPDVARLAVLVGALEQAQQDATKNLTKRLKQHPLAPWLKAQKGVGDKQAARLLAAIGDPYWNSLHDRPRTVSELWAYAGYHVLPAGQAGNDAHPSLASGGKTGHPDQSAVDAQTRCVGVAPKRARGAKANWSATAKMRTYLIAESCMKQLRKPCEKDAELGYALHIEDCQCSPFRIVYDATRAKYADATHAVECIRCGPKGKPAPAGSNLSDAHKMARALRAVSKELLKELWREARRLHLGIDLTEETS